MYTRYCARLQAGGSNAVEEGSSDVQAVSGLSLEEENDMRVEHALEILKADVRHCAQSALHATARS